MKQTAVEWLVANLDIDLVDSDWYIEKAKEMEDAQRKNDFIGGYLTHAMSKNKLPYGIEYLSKVAELEEKAEKLYNKPFKQQI